MFYLTTNEHRREPEEIQAINYVHIKAHTSGNYTLILTEEEIDSPQLQALPLEDAQILLNQWIAEENANLESPQQRPIDLLIYL